MATKKAGTSKAKATAKKATPKPKAAAKKATAKSKVTAKKAPKATAKPRVTAKKAPKATSKPKVTSKKAAKVTAKPKAMTPNEPAKPAPGGPAPTVGMMAPDFTLEGTDGVRHTLSGFRGRAVVVYFYPKDDTPGCTREAQGFEAARARFTDQGAVVFGVSRDSIASHCRFRDKYGLGFVLLSDPDLAVHRAYGAYGEKVMYGQKTLGVIRSTFLVGPDGRITHAWPRVKVDGHVEAVLAALG